MAETFAAAPAAPLRRHSPARILPTLVLFALSVFFLVGTGPNEELALLSLAVLVLGCAGLWRPGEPPILLYLFGYQWLEASLLIYSANLQDLPINQAGYFVSDAAWATVLALLGLLVQALGLRLGAGRAKAWYPGLLRNQIAREPSSRWFKLYLWATALGMASTVMASALPALSQPLLVLSRLKWVAYVIYTYAVFAGGDSRRRFWLMAFAFEFILGFQGYFSTFKFVIIFTFLAILGSVASVKRRLAIGLSLLVAVAILEGSVWTAIKPEYRAYLSGGEKAQIVTVDFSQRIAKLAEQLADLDVPTLRQGAEAMTSRIGYVQFFGATLLNVPANLPHTDGSVWWDAISRPFMPRLLFPEKSAIDESVFTATYSGVPVGGREQGTQASIGYVGDSYIDFGEYGMMLVLLVMGIVIGRIYRWLAYGLRSRGLLGFGESIMVIMTVVGIGMSSAKLVGALAVTVLMVWLFNRLIVPVWLPWLRVARRQG